MNSKNSQIFMLTRVQEGALRARGVGITELNNLKIGSFRAPCWLVDYD